VVHVPRLDHVKPNRDFLAERYDLFRRASWISAEQPIVFGVAPDPEPDESVVDLDRERAVAAPYPRRPDVSRLLEPKGRVPRILLEPIESLVGESLDLWREVPIRGPELRRSV